MVSKWFLCGFLVVVGGFLDGFLDGVLVLGGVSVVSR